MALKRMDNVGIVVDDLGGTVDFFQELGLELEDAASSVNPSTWAFFRTDPVLGE
jgi:catechol 2,3-dioxygenase-like lactoylglutathione lyase family enzyme